MKIYSYFSFSWSNTLKEAYPMLLRHNDETHCPKKKKRVKNTQSPCFFSKIEKLPTIYRQLRNWWRKVKHCWFLLSGTRKEQRKRWLNRGLESSPTSAVGPPISGHQGMTAMLVIRDGIIVKTNTESLAYTLTSTLLA